MQRVTITVDDNLMAEFDRYMETRGYGNRSEAFRDMLRDTLERERREKEAESDCIACLSFVYAHHERELSQRLTRAQHDHHDLNVSALHVHLDHDNCIEALILRGRVADVRRFADSVTAQTGVRHGNLHIVPLDMDAGVRAHWHGRPRT